MNLPSPTNPSKTPLRGPGRDDDLVGDVTFSDQSLCEFAAWMDHELARLEDHFAAFVTGKSRKRSFGR
jgi:hypothetical protein